MQMRSSDEKAVCLSIRPSVCLSNAWFVTKQKKVVPTFLYLMKDHLFTPRCRRWRTRRAGQRSDYIAREIKWLTRLLYTCVLISCTSVTCIMIYAENFMQRPEIPANNYVRNARKQSCSWRRGYLIFDIRSCRTICKTLTENKERVVNTKQSKSQQRTL